MTRASPARSAARGSATHSARDRGCRVRRQRHRTASRSPTAATPTRLRALSADLQPARAVVSDADRRHRRLPVAGRRQRCVHDHRRLHLQLRFQPGGRGGLQLPQRLRERCGVRCTANGSSVALCRAFCDFLEVPQRAGLVPRPGRPLPGARRQRRGMLMKRAIVLSALVLASAPWSRARRRRQADPAAQVRRGHAALRGRQAAHQPAEVPRKRSPSSTPPTTSTPIRSTSTTSPSPTSSPARTPTRSRTTGCSSTRCRGQDRRQREPLPGAARGQARRRACGRAQGGRGGARDRRGRAREEPARSRPARHAGDRSGGACRVAAEPARCARRRREGRARRRRAIAGTARPGHPAHRALAAGCRDRAGGRR